MSDPNVGYRIKDSDGREFEFYVDEYKRRWWRCCEDHGKLVPYSVMQPPPDPRARVGGYLNENAWLESYNAY